MAGHKEYPSLRVSFNLVKSQATHLTCISIMARNLIPMGIYNEFFFGSKTNNNIKIFMANL
jgi:hypothetical protein